MKRMFKVVSKFVNDLKLLFLAFGCSVLLFGQVYANTTYGPGINDTEWRLEPSIFGCNFSQPIPYFGFASFYREAGEDVLFHLTSSHQQLKKENVPVTIEAPAWRPSALAEHLTYAKIAPIEDQLLEIAPQHAKRMIAQLDQGMAPTINANSKYNAQQIRVQLSPIRFRYYYNDYLACVAGLLPVNFRQVEKNSILFAPGSESLDERAKNQLDLIAIYVNADPKVTSIFVDGHTDEIGTRYENRRLAERRSNLVTDYLVGAGLTPESILTRYHGERYPVTTNETSSGRRLNRRVTVRLERIED